MVLPNQKRPVAGGVSEGAAGVKSNKVVAQKSGLASGLQGKKNSGQNNEIQAGGVKKITSREARNIRYHSAEKFSLVEFIRKNMSKDFIPTQKSGYILGAIFLLVIIIGLLQFPFGSFLSGQGELSIRVGIPYSFLVFDIVEPENNPFVLKGFFIDLIIYIIVAYILDVIINFTISFIKSTRKSEQEKKPEVVKAPSSTLADKLTRSVVSKPVPEKKYKTFGKPKSIEVFEVGKKKAV